MLPITLDSEQSKVVAHAAGPLAVFGGPGTGKTRVLEERFIELARQPGCSADRILLLVPNRTQKMALQERITRRLLFEEGLPAVVEVPVYTWHGFANHLVSRHYDRLAYTEPPVLLTSPEHWGDVRDALANEPPDSWSAPYNLLLRNRGFVDEVVDFSIRAEQRLLDPADLTRLVELRPEWADIVRFFKAHSERLRQRSRIDYPTLLADAAELVATHDDLREVLHQRFMHVLVDDAQELARVQQRFLLFLTGFADKPQSQGRSLVVAADPDSSIETFRGAEPDWLDSFAKDFGAHDTVTLPVSYRLGAEAGEAAVSFIGRNGSAPHRPVRFDGATTLESHRYGSLAAEMDAVARSLRLAHLQEGTSYDAMAILLTSPRSMLPALERALGALEVPYSISAPDRPLEREAVVRAFIELARFAYADTPDPEVVADLLRSPLAGLTSQQVRQLERDAHGAGQTLDELILNLPDTHDAAEPVKHVLELRDLLVGSASAPADRSFWLVWDKATYYEGLQATARRGLDDPANRELDALVAFSKALGRFVERRHGRGTTLPEYLQSLGRADFGSDPWLPPERRSGGVEILSFHAAKGKEWDVVYVCGCVEGSIPKGRRAQGLFDPYFLDGFGAAERVQRNEAEDRRVFYVATTRARQRCVITASPGPSRRGQPSRFVAEIAGALPEVEASAESSPLTFSEAAARARRLLADPKADPAGRMAAAQTIARICELDPTCTAALPREWWWRWDWTEGAIPINAQRHGDDDVPADKLRTSYSRISEYDNCGLKYLLGVVLGLDPSTSHNLFFGTWIHKIFEEVDRKLLTTDAMVFDRYQELFDEKVFPNKAIARQFRHDGEVMLRRFIDQLGPGLALLAELPFRVELDGHVITGRIDRVDKAGKGVMVSDYKTSRYPIWYSDVEKSLQLAIYYLAAQKDPAIAEHGAPVGMRLVYPGHMSRGEVSTRVQQPAAAEKILAELPLLMDKVLEEDFRPSPLADCMWCRFKPLCPLWPEGKEVPV